MTIVITIFIAITKITIKIVYQDITIIVALTIKTALTKLIANTIVTTIRNEFKINKFEF